MKKDVRSMKLTMQLKSRSYDIILKAGCLANLHQFTNVQHRKVFVLTDSGVPAAYAQTIDVYKRQILCRRGGAEPAPAERWVQKI